MEAYDVPGTANQRLDRTVVFYDRVPYLAIAETAEPTATNTEKFGLVKLGASGSRKTHTGVPYTSEKFTAEFPQLGWMNYNDGCIFLTRKPTRRTRHGLCAENLSVSLSSAPHEVPGTDTLIMTKELVDVILGKYPDQQHALGKMREGDSGCAFDRDFAFIRMPSQVTGLYYKNSLVGTIDVRATKPVIRAVESPAASIFFHVYGSRSFPIELRG